MFWPFLFLKLCYIYWHTLKPCRMVIFIFIFLLSGTFRWNFYFHLKNILTFIQWMRWKRSFGSEKIPCLSFLFIINDDTLGFLLLGFWFCFVPHLLLHFCEKRLNFVLIWQFFLTIPITFVFLLSLSLTHFYDSVIVFAMMYLYSWIYSIMLPLIQDSKFKIMQKVKFNFFFLCLLLNYFIKVTKIQTSFCKEKQVNKSGFLILI